MPLCHLVRMTRRVRVPSGMQKVLSITLQKIDPVVQLVRMPPCHGGGRGFESRPDRKQKCKLLQNPLNLVDLKGFYFAFKAKSGKNSHNKGGQFGVLF